MTETFKAHCPRCDGERVCDIHGGITIPWDWTDGLHSANGEKAHKLLQCRGCETVFYHLSSWESEEWDHRIGLDGTEEVFYPERTETYPAPEKKGDKPDWVWTLDKVDMQLAKIMREMYGAYDAGFLILASVGLRTAFDRITEIFKVDPGYPLEQKVKKLLSAGVIGETEAATLQVVVDAGSAAAHRGWSPEREEFQLLLNTLEQFIQRTIVSGEQVMVVFQKMPPRQPRPPKAPAT